MELKNICGNVIFALEGAKTVLEVVKSAFEAKKSLRGADLRSADLSGAYLRNADLRGAYLRNADLRGAYLRGADLRGADLRGADLNGADLRGAYLSGADLSRAYLSGAYLRNADLRGAYLRNADLRRADLSHAYLNGADLSGADLSGADLRRGLDGVPVIPEIHKAVYAAAASNPDALDMSNWHTCETTHCRAGWVIALAGPGGKALEWALGSAAAAAMIYMASDPKLEKIPDFHASDEVAIKDMKRLAEGKMR